MAFTGIPPAALDFYARLEADNSKAFWQANKAVYRDEVKASVEAMCDELSEYGPFHLFRPYNDVRFAKNRPPYKTQQGAYVESEGGAGFYFHISREGLMAAAGYYAMMRDQLERFRDAVDATNTGEEIADYRKAYGDIPVIAHPECPPDVLAEADFVGSTHAMIEWITTQQPSRVMMITECSMADNVARDTPNTEYVRPCNLCPYMKRITLDNIRTSLATLTHQVEIAPEVAHRARKAVMRMLEVGRKD